MPDPDLNPEELAAQIKTLTAAQKAKLAEYFNDEEAIQLIQPHLNRVAVRATINQHGNEIIVPMINSHNPYTSNDPKDMSVFVGNPNPDNDAVNNINQVEIEVDGPYSMPMEWNFKGSPQKINKTLRIKYRYRPRNLAIIPNQPLLEPHHWVTAYLLIGFEDGGL
jgi:hypothetical protein